MAEPQHTPDRLLRHAAFVRRVAAGLLDDAQLAEDVTQETLLAGLRAPFPAPRRWLGTVARRLAQRERRARQRRGRRERASARVEAVPATDAARAESLRRVCDAVLELPPTWREAVLLRFYEDLKPRQIAGRLGLSVTAVRSRLRRALAELRARLERQDGEWRLGLGALVGPPWENTAAGALAGGLVVGSKVLVGAALCAAAVLLWLLIRPLDAPGVPGVAAGSAGSAATPDASAADHERTERRAVSAPDATGEAESFALLRTILTGLVLDERRFPVAGARVHLHGRGEPDAVATSDDRGRFRLRLALGPGTGWNGSVVARHRGRTGLRSVSVSAYQSPEVDLGAVVLSGGEQLTVRVLERGAPVAGARVIARPPGHVFEPYRWQSETGSDGVAVLEGMERGAYRIDAVRADARASKLVDLTGTNGSVLLDLSAGAQLTVVVFEPASGVPVSGARVRAWEKIPTEGGGSGILALHTVAELPVTDAGGRCLLRGLRPGSILNLSAEAEGHDPSASESGLREVVVESGAEVRLPLARSLDRTGTWPIGLGEVPAPGEGEVLRLVPGAPGMDPPAETGTVRDGHLVVEGLRPGRGYSFLVASNGGALARAVIDHRDEVGDPLTFRRPRHAEVVVRDLRGEPLPDWPVCFRSSTDPAQLGPIRTDTEGTARFGPVYGGSWLARLDDDFLSMTGDELDLGTLELENGDARLEVVRAPGVPVTARVWVDGERRLPPRLDVHADNAFCGDLVEDPQSGEVRFTLWRHDPDKTSQVRLYGPWDYGIALAEVPPGVVSAGIDLRLDRLARATVRVVPPEDGRYRVYLERGFGRSWAVWSHYRETSATGPAERSFRNLRPGRYRVRDELSGVTSEEVEVVAGAPAARLGLDLSAVTTLRGRVVVPPGSAREGTDLVVEGALVFRDRVQPDGTFTVRLPLTAPLRLTLRHPSLQPDPQLGSIEVHGPAEDLLLYLVER